MLQLKIYYIMDLKTDIDKLFQNLAIINGNLVLKENLHNYPNKSDKYINEDLLYLKYQNGNAQKILEEDEDIEALKPFINDFNESRFWFVVNSTSIKLLNGQKLIQKEGQSIIIDPGQYINGGKFKEGEKDTEFVYLLRGKRFDKANDNYYVFIEGDFSYKTFYRPLVRFYFNLKPRKIEILAWADEIQEYLNKYRIPFQLKFPLNLSNYYKSDTGVLYVLQNHFPIVANLINRIYLKFQCTTGEKGGLFDKDVPLFTKQIYKEVGIGFAEDPNSEDSQESFGKNITKEVFKIIKGCESIEKAKKAVEEEFTNLYPYGTFRNPNTHYNYDFDKVFNIQYTPSPTFGNTNAVFTEIKYIPMVGDVQKKAYLNIARKYALDLITKGIWGPEKKEYNWITYDEESHGEGFCRMLNDKEKAIMRYFLFKISDFVEDKDYFGNIATQINPEKGFMPYKKVIGTFLKESFIVHLNQAKIWHNKTDFQENTDVAKLLEAIKMDENEQGNENFLYTSSLLEKVASFLVNYYENHEIPLKNSFGTYDFCSNDKGVLGVGLFFLVAYYPRAFPELYKSDEGK